MSNVSQLGRSDSLDPRALLLEVLNSERAENYEEVCIVVKYKDGTSSFWHTCQDPWLLFGVASIIQNEAVIAQNEERVL